MLGIYCAGHPIEFNNFNNLFITGDLYRVSPYDKEKR